MWVWGFTTLWTTRTTRRRRIWRSLTLGCITSALKLCTLNCSTKWIFRNNYELVHLWLVSGPNLYKLGQFKWHQKDLPKFHLLDLAEIVGLLLLLVCAILPLLHIDDVTCHTHLCLQTLKGTKHQQSWSHSRPRWRTFLLKWCIMLATSMESSS